VIRQAYALFNDEQFSEAEQLLDPGVVFELSPRMPFAGTRS